jgi:hypothetical protein
MGENNCKGCGAVMNNTCIDMRVIAPNIYMYMRGNYKKHLKEYNNKKDYYISNSI